MLTVKILSLGAAERYAVRRLVTAAYQELCQHTPKPELTVIEVTDAADIGELARVLVLPTLVMNGKAVCSGRFPSRAEVLAWMQEAVR